MHIAITNVLRISSQPNWGGVPKKERTELVCPYGRLIGGASEIGVWRVVTTGTALRDVHPYRVVIWALGCITPIAVIWRLGPGGRRGILPCDAWFGRAGLERAPVSVNIHYR